MRDFLANLFIDGMPFSFGVRAGVSLLLWFIIWRQGSETILGHWINRFFFVTFLTSLWLVYLTSYLMRNADATNISGINEWSLIIGLNVLPLISTLFGFKVAFWVQRGEQPEGKDDRDTRQDTREDSLDVRADAADERGKQQDDRGHTQDDRQTEMNTERHDLDSERKDFDERER